MMALENPLERGDGIGDGFGPPSSLEDRLLHRVALRVTDFDDVDVGALDVLLAGGLQLVAEHRGCWQMLAAPLRVSAVQVGAAARNGENDLRVAHTRA